MGIVAEGESQIGPQLGVAEDLAVAMREAAHIIDSDTSSACGGHISVSVHGLAPSALAMKLVRRMGLLYAVLLLMAAGPMSLWNYCVHRQVEAALEKREHLRNRESHLQKLNTEIEQ